MGARAVSLTKATRRNDLRLSGAYSSDAAGRRTEHRGFIGVPDGEPFVVDLRPSRVRDVGNELANRYHGRMTLEIHTADHVAFPLPPEHHFPAGKYAAVRAELVADARRDIDRFCPGAAVDDASIRLAHDPAYVERWLTGKLSLVEIRDSGFPWSDELMLRTRVSLGATLGAVRSAAKWGVGCSLAGGTHHAHRDRASGYCIFNDLAIAAKDILVRDPRARILIADLDVHQGDGTAAITADDDRIFTFSMHGAKNFPRIKQASTRDVALPDGTDDRLFLDRLRSELPEIRQRFDPTFILYQAGVDILAGDRLGRLALTLQGIMERDRVMFSFAKTHAIPIASVMGGGYGKDIQATIRAHANVVRAARDVFFGAMTVRIVER